LFIGWRRERRSGSWLPYPSRNATRILFSFDLNVKTYLVIEDGQQAIYYGSEDHNAKKRQWRMRVGRVRR
jgi:hypothetical protein